MNKIVRDINLVSVKYFSHANITDNYIQELVNIFLY